MKPHFTNTRPISFYLYFTLRYIKASWYCNNAASWFHLSYKEETVVQFSSVAQSCPTLRPHARQASLSITNSRSCGSTPVKSFVLRLWGQPGSSFPRCAIWVKTSDSLYLRLKTNNTEWMTPRFPAMVEEWHWASTPRNRPRLVLSTTHLTGFWREAGLRERPGCTWTVKRGAITSYELLAAQSHSVNQDPWGAFRPHPGGPGD